MNRIESSSGYYLTPPFLPGATDHDLDRLATETGLVLPDDLCALLRASVSQDGLSQLYGPVDFHHFLKSKK